MFKLCNNYLKLIFLFFIGGFLYVSIELAFRGRSHISMLVAGGASFLLIGLLNEVFTWRIPVMIQMFLSSIIVTVIEFFTGIVVNMWLNLGVWDYSDLPFNYMGQVCLTFSVAWFFLSLPAILLDDYLRYWLLDGEKPRYKLF